MDKLQEANDRAAFARIWATVGCFGSSHSAQQPTLNIQPSSQPSAVKGPEKYPPGLLHAYARRASSSAFPSDGRPSHTDFNINHYGAIQKRERIHIPDWRAKNGDSVIHPPSRFYPFGTSQPSHASGRTRVKRSQSVAFLSSSVKTYARTSVKPVSPIKCLPFPNRRKRNAVSGPGDQLALPGKQKSFFKPHVFPLRLAFPYARYGPPSSYHKLQPRK